MTPHLPPPRLSRSEVTALLAQAGVIASLEAEFSADEILEIGDALLASPVLAATIVLTGSHSLRHIAALRSRGGEHLLVGANNISSDVDVTLAVAAGAQFLVSPFLDRKAAASAGSLDVLYVPGVFTRTEARQALAEGYRLQHLYPADILGASHLFELQIALPDCRFIPAGGISLEDIHLYAQQGATSVIVESYPPSPQAWSQAEVITHFRRLRRLWEQGSGGKGRNHRIDQ